MFKKSSEFYKWEILRNRGDFKKESDLVREKHKEALTKVSFLFHDYPPKLNENYDSWKKRITAFISVPFPLLRLTHSKPLLTQKELESLPDRMFYYKYGLPYPIPHTVEYPHPVILHWLTPSRVRVLSLIDRKENCLDLRIDLDGKESQIFGEMKEIIRFHRRHRYLEDEKDAKEKRDIGNTVRHDFCL